MHNIALAVAQTHAAAQAASADPERDLPYIIIALIIFRIALAVFGRRT
jgi:hypothetical protein